MKRAGDIALRAALAALLAFGIFASVERARSVVSDDPGELDRRQVEAIAAVAGLSAGSDEHVRLSREIPISARNLNDQPHATLWHVLPGAAFFLLVPIQFSRRIRSRHPALHRWNGRAILVVVSAAAAAGIYLGFTQTYGGIWETAATTFFGGLLLFCAALGYAAIRRRDMARHREWMIRVFAIGVGISVIRVIGMAALLAFGTEGINPSGFSLNLWVGWLVSILAAELWILRTRPRRLVESEAAVTLHHDELGARTAD